MIGQLEIKMLFRRFSRRQLMYMGALLLVAVTGLVAGLTLLVNQPSTETSTVRQPAYEPENETLDENSKEPPKEPPTASSNTTPVKPAQPPSAPSPVTTAPPFLFGIGTELDHAINYRITKESRIKLLTSWFNGTNDLGFMNGWRTTLVPKAYASGYALHLIIYSNDAEQDINTKYGPACGRPYPLSQQFLADMQQLAKNFSGGKLYVSMFTELQTYPCIDNIWTSGENYYRALQDQYISAMNIFHQHAPGSQVSLSWGGWQTNWDDPGKGGGRSLFKYFADVMNASDFQSFQAMANTGNLTIITNMTKALQPYKGGVMVAHYKPDNGNQGAFNADMTNIFTPANIATFQQHELFAFSFMDTVNMNSSESAYQTVKNIIQTYAR